jgi:hypothetical protein
MLGPGQALSVSLVKGGAGKLCLRIEEDVTVWVCRKSSMQEEISN